MYLCTYCIALCHHPVPLCTDSDYLFLPSADDLFRHVRSISSSRSRRDANQHETRNHASCKLKPLFVKFKDFEDMNYVLRPKVVNIYDCEGRCDHFSKWSSDNAHMRNSMWLAKKEVLFLQSDRCPFPTCVPSAYKALPMLLYIKDNVVLKSPKNMIAKECHCN